MMHTEHNQANEDLGQDEALWDVAVPPPPGQNIPQHVPPVAPIDPPIAPAPLPDFMGGDPVVNFGQEGELWDVAVPPPPGQNIPQHVPPVAPIDPLIAPAPPPLRGFADRVSDKRDNPGKGGHRTP